MIEVEEEREIAQLHACEDEVVRTVRLLVREALAIGREQGRRSAERVCEEYIVELQQTHASLTFEQIALIEELFPVYRGHGPSLLATARYATLAESATAILERLTAIKRELGRVDGERACSAGSSE